MRKISKITISFLLIVSPYALFSQEVSSWLEGNAVAQKYYQGKKTLKKSNSPIDTIEIPFIDDFSDSFVEPKPGLWSDRHAFINNSYAIFPITAGVATLDALDFDGSHYPAANSFPYQADYLTSQAINLNYLPSDSIYLSFYYQPGGLAEPPETGDSLILEFYNPADSLWVKTWSTPGIYTPKLFTRVMLKIDDPAYLKKGFRFRFKNYASQISNTDQFDKRANVDLWHIDYLELDKNRFISDTVNRDVAFIDPIKSILKDYTSLPWSHFEAAYNTQRAPFIAVVIQNHDTISRNIGTTLEIRDLLNSKPVYKVPVLFNDLPSGDTIFYNYSYNYPFDFSIGDSGAFEIKTIIQTDVFDYKPNDTLRHIQKFHDHYALDDGTAEASYGFRGAGTKDASSALKYNSFLGDTLRAIDMYFVQIVDSVNTEYYFYLNVWADNAGKPGTKIIDQIGMRPEYSDELNKFVRYRLDSAIYVKDAFYIGFTQTLEKLLNVGLDLNRPNKSRIFNNIENGIWNTTVTLPGTPMMRPVFGKDQTVGIENKPTVMFSAFPIPADNYIKIRMNENLLLSASSSLELIDVSGRTVRTLNPNLEDTVTTSDLQNGMYFLRLYDPASKKSSAIKIIINH